MEQSGGAAFADGTCNEEFLQEAVLPPKLAQHADADETAVAGQLPIIHTSLSQQVQPTTASCSLAVSSAASVHRCLSEDSDEMSPQLRATVSFEGQRHLLRAIRLNSLMRFGAAVLAKAEGSERTYALSEEEVAIEVFLSHNWVVGRLKKFFCLSMHFKFGLALVAAMSGVAAMAVAACLGARVLVVERAIAFDASMGTLEHGHGCTLVMPPLFLLVAFVGHDLQRLVGLHGPRMFLDKTCIHQVDKQVQKQGILKLGAFLRMSSRMVIVYTDIYLTKLWTVYEVACFLSLHPTSHLVVLPTFQPVIVFGGIASLFVIRMVGLMLLTQGLALLISTFFLRGLVIVALTVILRRWARDKAAIHQRIARFHVDACTCFCEDDRPVVYQNIAVLMREVGIVDADANEQTALDAFSGLARQCLPTALTASIGPAGLSYRHVTNIWLCNTLPFAIDVCMLGAVSHQEEWITRFRVCSLLWNASLIFGIYPLLFVLISAWCGRCLALRRYAEVGFLGIGMVFTLVLFMVLVSGTERLMQASYQPGPHRDAYAAGLAAFLAASVVLAVALFARGKGRTEEDELRKETAAKAGEALAGAGGVFGRLGGEPAPKKTEEAQQAAVATPAVLGEEQDKRQEDIVCDGDISPQLQDHSDEFLYCDQQHAKVCLFAL